MLSAMLHFVVFYYYAHDLHTSRMIKDERIREKELRTIFDVEEAPNKLG